MASSRKQLMIDSKDNEQTEGTAVPVDMINIMLDYADGMGKVTGYGTVPLVSTLFHAHKTARLKALLTAVVSGKPDDAIAMLDKDPSLLLEKLAENEFVMAPMGYQFNLQPYQAAIAVGDYQMAKLLESYFADKVEAMRQFQEQCPKGWQAKEEERWQHIYAQRDKLVLAIRDSKTNDITSSGDPDYIISLRRGSPIEQELHAFWKLLDAKLNETITVGKRPFNLNLLFTTLQIYDCHYADYFGGSCVDPRNLIFVQKVIGYEGMQRYMSTHDVQAYHDGLYTTVGKLKNNELQARSTIFEIKHSGNWVSTSFYPLKHRGSQGFNFAIYAVGNRKGLGTMRDGMTDMWGGAMVLNEYIKQKQQAYTTLCNHTEPRPSGSGAQNA